MAMAEETDTAIKPTPSRPRSRVPTQRHIPHGISRIVLLLIVVGVSCCIGPQFLNWPAWEIALLKSGAFSSVCPDSEVSQFTKTVALSPAPEQQTLSDASAHFLSDRVSHERFEALHFYFSEDSVPMNSARRLDTSAANTNKHKGTVRVTNSALPTMLVAGLFENAVGYAQTIPEEAVCLEQDQKINAIMPLAAMCMFVGTFVAGWGLDFIGPRRCSMIGMTLLVVAWALLSLASESFSSYRAAFALMGAGSDLAFFGTLTVPNLFPERQGTIIAFLGAGRAVSSIIPLFIRVSLPQVSLRISSLVMVGVLVICFVLLAVFLPLYAFDLSHPDQGAMPIAGPTPEPVKTKLVARERSTPLDIDEYPSMYPASKMEILKDQCVEFIQFLLKMDFLLILPFHASNLIRNNFYTNSSNNQLGTSAAQVLAIATALNFFSSPCFGYLADKRSVFLVLSILNTLGTLLYIFLLMAGIFDSPVGSDVFRFLSIAMSYFFSGFLLSQLFVYVAERFPKEHMGKLSGFASMIGGLVALVVTPMTNSSTSRNNFVPMNILCIGLSLLNYGVLVVLWFRGRRQQHAKDTKTESHADVVTPQTSHSNYSL